MSTATPAPTPPPATSPPTAPPPKPSRFGKWAGFLIVTGFLLVGWLILAMFRHNVSYTEWPLYIILSMIGFGLSFTTKARMNKFIPFAIGGFLLVVAIMMATPWAIFDGDWAWAKWLALALVLTALILVLFKKWWVAAVAGAVALAIATGVSASSWQMEPLNLSANPATTTASTTQATTASPTTTSPTTQVCQFGLADGWVENPSYQVILNGLPADPAKAKARMLEQAQVNPVFVWGYAVDKGLSGLGLSAENLRNGSCWTKEGRELATKVAGIIESSKVTLGEASKNDTNTGGHNGRLVRNETPGITGDRRAIVLTHPDGSKTVVLIRCGNFVYQEVPAGIPTGPTDETPVKQRPTAQPPGTTSPPAKTTPPRTTPPSLTPKNPAKDPARQGNVPPQVRGKAPKPAPTASAPAVPRPDPTSAYTPQPPPPPVATAPGTTSRPTDLPAPVPGAPTAPGSPRTTAPPPTWPGN